MRHYHEAVPRRCCAIFVLGCCTAGGGCASPPKGFASPEPAARLAAITRADATHDQSSIPHLIESLSSDDPLVRMAAIRTLESLTGETLGYQYWAPEPQRLAAARRWDDWYARKRGGPAEPERGSAVGVRADTEGDSTR
jgi:HEAT repeat protein